MTIADKLLLGFNTTVNGMGIVFMVLIVLWAAIVAQSKLISFFTERLKKRESVDSSINVDKVVSDIVDDEMQAVIMAVVSDYEGVSLSRLQFNSIKEL